MSAKTHVTVPDPFTIHPGIVTGSPFFVNTIARMRHGAVLLALPDTACTSPALVERFEKHLPAPTVWPAPRRSPRTGTALRARNQSRSRDADVGPTMSPGGYDTSLAVICQPSRFTAGVSRCASGFADGRPFDSRARAFGDRPLAQGQRASCSLRWRSRIPVDRSSLHPRSAAASPLTASPRVTVMLDGYCFEWWTLLRATTPFASSKLLPPVFRLRSKRGKLLLDTSMRSRCPGAK